MRKIKKYIKTLLGNKDDNRCNIAKQEDFLKIKANKSMSTLKINDDYDYRKYAGFYGNISKSRNKKNIIIWNTGCLQEGGKNNEFSYITGQFAVFSEKKILFKKSYSPSYRILNSIIANSGTVGICFNVEKEEMRNILFLYNKTLNKSFSLTIEANFNIVCFSSSEKYLLIQSYASKTLHSNKVMLINTLTGNIRFIFDTPTYFQNADIDDDRKIISIKDSNNTVFYSITFCDNKSRRVLLEKMNTEGKIYHLENTSSKESLLNNPYYAELIESTRSLMRNPHMLRKLGEYYDHNKNIEKAIFYYEKAVFLYDKIGVKRRLNKLKKQQQINLTGFKNL